MCFFFVFGIAPRETYIGTENRFCSYCGRETPHTIYARRMWFSLFFIPLFPVSRKQIIMRCNSCGFDHY
ncbi:zinc ribbon domain-containing protein [bacterium]|nr:zinc ribbon domain-containing protein [bacterium]